ncbi:MAG: hypothetical protein E7672_04610 [Ruminococcaceae bacterium]|nr:hypothetical protein [Oscillospiraceae bacterium]
MNQEIEKYCKFCERATGLNDPDTMLCEKYGVVSASHVCRKFCYDPLKREPSKKAKEPKLEYVEI